MEGRFLPPWRRGSWNGLEDAQEIEQLRMVSSLAAIPQPSTPHEPMEFLSRSWSLSASEISKALSEKQKPGFLDRIPDKFPEITSKLTNSANCRRLANLGKWFHQKQHRNNIVDTNITVKKKDRTRLENARVHSALSIAGLAAALAAVAASENSNGCHSKLHVALASATELLASHCVEMAELAGANRDRVASTVRSAVDIRTPGDLMTLTAAAATALRGEAALRARLPKEVKKNASISPCDRGNNETRRLPAFDTQVREGHPPFGGDLLQLTQKGALRWKQVSVYINKKSQVIIKLKSKHVGGAFSKKSKCIVYGVCDEDAAWPYRKEREESEELYFGLKTAQGLLEFKCKNKLHKQKWVDEIKSLLHRIDSVEAAERSLEFLGVGTNT